MTSTTAPTSTDQEVATGTADSPAKHRATTDADEVGVFRGRNFRAPDSLWDAFREKAASEGANPAEILRELMRRYLRGEW